MQTRDYQQETAKDMGTAGTLTFPLDFVDPITEISLLFAATNGASYNKNNPIDRNISRIEIVDGGEVLWSVPGDVALGAQAHLQNSLPHCYRTGAVSDAPYMVIPLRFGRYLYDQLFAFNPSAHRNPQLKVTFDEATVRAAGATGYVSDSFTVTVNIRLMEDAPAPQGFLALREIETFTSLGSGEHIVNLPTDMLIRALINRVYVAGTDQRSNITRWKLSGDGGKRVPFDLDVGTIVDYMAEVFNPLMVPLYTTADDQEELETWVAIDLEAFCHAHQGQIIVAGTEAWPSQIKVYFYTDAGVEANNQAIHIGVFGWGINGCLIYPFGRLDEPSDWFDPRGINKLDLALKQESAGAEVNVCLQHVRPY